MILKESLLNINRMFNLFLGFLARQIITTGGFTVLPSPNDADISEGGEVSWGQPAIVRTMDFDVRSPTISFRCRGRQKT